MHALPNLIANIIISCSTIALVFTLFGRPNSAAWKNKFSAIFAKAALCITACGSLSNVVTMSDPQATEVLLNVGLAGTLSWLAYYIYTNIENH